ncbi:hypothetical protein MKX01_014699, partial [Papaver californicum]
MSSSSDSWLTSLSCSASLIIQDKMLSLSTILQWTRFIFLSPCPQRVLLSSINLLFLFIFILLTLQKLFSRFLKKSNTSSINKPLITRTSNLVSVNLWSYLSLILSALLSVSYLVFSIIAFTSKLESSWKLTEALFQSVLAITHLVITVLIIHEKKFQATTHPMLIRIYWIVNFIFVMLFSVSSIVHFTGKQQTLETELRIDNIFFLVNLPISGYLLVVAVKGFTGITVKRELESDEYESGLSLKTPLLNKSVPTELWLWMNPLLQRGYKSPLKLDEVPSLALNHKAERMSVIFEMNFPKPEENSKHPVRTIEARIRFLETFGFYCFSSDNSSLCYYMGLILLQQFVNFTAGLGSSPYQGYYLVLILLSAKVFEFFCSHQYNFQSQKLGMLIRSTLITSLYKKGLRLSCSGRQEHGLGSILSDMMLQLHYIWLMPVQVGVVLALLYFNLGASAFSALVGIFGVTVFVVLGTKRNNRYQFNLMKQRGSKLKAMNEMLNYMRRIQEFRSAKFSWLTKFMYSIYGNIIVLWSAPVLVSTLTFATTIWLGVPLTAGTVFTATSLFKVLQEKKHD